MPKPPTQTCRTCAWWLPLRRSDAGKGCGACELRDGEAGAAYTHRAHACRFWRAVTRAMTSDTGGLHRARVRGLLVPHPGGRRMPTADVWRDPRSGALSDPYTGDSLHPRWL